MDTIVGDKTARKCTPRPLNKRAHSFSPSSLRTPSPNSIDKSGKERRCRSLNPQQIQKPMEPTKDKNTIYGKEFMSAPEKLDSMIESFQNSMNHEPEKDIITMPHCLLSKALRAIATKKREFMKLRKSLLHQQDSFLEHLAALRELESRAGVCDESLTDIRIVSLPGWPAHDILLLLRCDGESPLKSNGCLGTQVLQQLQAQLGPIPEQVLSMGAEIMARRIELLNILRCKHRCDRATYHTNLEWKSKNSDYDNETEQLHRLVAGTAENLKEKITYSMELVKVPWLDRENFVKKIERLQKDNSLLHMKIEEFTKKENQADGEKPDENVDSAEKYQAVCDELAKEQAAREALKDVVTAAESMLRVARARVATLEKQLKDTRAELELARKKHKDLEQLYRHRETSYDARSRKLIEVSKTGEMTIDALSRQRDALELRVKELREEAETAEKEAALREQDQKARNEMLQAKVAEQEKGRKVAQSNVTELEARIKELEEQLRSIRERSMRLVDLERKRVLEYIPSKETEPSDNETEIWKELQVTRVALSRAEDDLRQARADKESFLNSLSKIAQEEGANKDDKLATELLSREQKILALQRVIETHLENEKIMEQSMTEYENQLATMRLEIKKLRNYDCYSKDITYQDLQTELLDMQIQVETLKRERSALVSAAASRALMLERHERAADLFAKMTRARRDLQAILEGRPDPPESDASIFPEVSRSLTSMSSYAADTWSALRAERARVIHLESAVLAQSLQLEREGRVRTQLERRRAVLEREILRARHSTGSSQPHSVFNSKNSSQF
ncbi:rho-associated protein kinase 1-like isoform X2 [Pieris brassicae]|uniref:rho-associated protein kinase 1-like isoform X2 n=1 Tax=Pieris brassicae TaxID=7116 RepID=UPI001E660E64|nr:rho-associated protein kinase 1-like isoform X2 [Pieris brassicae]